MKPGIPPVFINANQTNDPTGCGLLLTMAQAVIAASLLGMVLYTLVEYLIQRPSAWAEFFVHHLMHTLNVVSVVAVVASMTMQKFVPGCYCPQPPGCGIWQGGPMAYPLRRRLRELAVLP